MRLFPTLGNDPNICFSCYKILLNALYSSYLHIVRKLREGWGIEIFANFVVHSFSRSSAMSEAVLHCSSEFYVWDNINAAVKVEVGLLKLF